MKTKQIIGLIVAAAVFIVTGAASVLTDALSERILGDTAKELFTGGVEFSSPMEDYIAVVRVEGTIQEQVDAGLFAELEGYQHTTTMEYIDRLMMDDYNRGILLYVDSPGGTVYESEELYDRLQEYRDLTGRPIWCYMAHYAASGGYMAAVAADKIYANMNTVTGSIGVIMSGYDITGLYEKLGIRYYSITSGDYKDSMQMTEDQMAVYQSQVDECYARFVEKVSAGRGMDLSEVTDLADGRTYTAQQAKDNGLIDEISSYEDMKYQMEEELGTDTFYEPSAGENVFASLFAQIRDMVPKSEAQVLSETADEMESGVLMYYAEQLQ
ncbi:MAG TPA: signal peptide peptidase SppA [Candidatus Mediterraneibacter excrementavium]|nr:signal peptide peptidase SppA [Candidatus Mediterraneibacter excrementavium]